jgi:hypothetical protein
MTSANLDIADPNYTTFADTPGITRAALSTGGRAKSNVLSIQLDLCEHQPHQRAVLGEWPSP